MKVGLIVVGVVIAALGLLNHYAIHQNPVAHTSTILLAVGGVVAVVGIAMTFMGNKA